MTDDIQWINASSDKALKMHGITCGKARVDDGMKALRRREIQLLIESDVPQAQAQEMVSRDFIREGTNRAGNTVWQINAQRAGELARWIDDQRHWISATNHERLRPLGITEGDERLDHALAALSRESIQHHQKSMSLPAARRYVAEHIVRKGETEQNNSVWQIHESAIPQLRKQLDTPSEWINSHDRTELAQLGVVLRSTEIDAELSRYYPELVLKTGMQQGISAQQAEQVINDTMIRRGETRYGLDSWDIKRDYLPTLIAKELPSLRPRKEAGWLSATSTKLKTLAHPFGGISGRRSSIEHAMSTLHDRLITEHAETMGEVRARNYVEENCVRPAEGQRAIATWKIRDNDPTLIERLVDTKNELYPPRQSGHGLA